MEFSNLKHREARKLEDDFIASKEKWSLDFPNGLPKIHVSQVYPFLQDVSFTEAVPLSALIKMEYDYFQWKFNQLQTQYANMQGKSHYWIGINPDPKTQNLVKLASSMEEVVRKFKFMQSGYLYCLEQHTSTGVRPHVHLMLSCSAKPHRVIDTLAKYFKIPKNFIDLKRYSNNVLFDEHVKYIQGHKKLEKQEFVALDIKELESLQLQKFYGNENFCKN